MCIQHVIDVKMWINRYQLDQINKLAGNGYDLEMAC